MFNTIINIGDGTQYEGKAEAAITPGMLVEELSTGNIQKQATAKANVESAVAIENSLIGEGIADDYATGTNVLYRVWASGEQALLIVKQGETIAIGDDLESAGGGEVQLLTSAGTNPIGVARNAVLANASSATPLANRRVIVRFK